VRGELLVVATETTGEGDATRVTLVVVFGRAGARDAGADGDVAALGFVGAAGFDVGAWPACLEARAPGDAAAGAVCRVTGADAAAGAVCWVAGADAAAGAGCRVAGADTATDAGGRVTGATFGSFDASRAWTTAGLTAAAAAPRISEMTFARGVRGTAAAAPPVNASNATSDKQADKATVRSVTPRTLPSGIAAAEVDLRTESLTEGKTVTNAHRQPATTTSQSH